ncbi:MAG: DMT family transporter [Chloroflexota bacterium]
MTPRLRADLALVLVTAVWGATFVMVKDALLDLAPFWFLTFRFGLAALLLAPLALYPSSIGSGSAVKAGIMVGSFLFLGYSLQTVGLQYTSASRAGFITGLTVVFVPIGQSLILRTRPKSATTAGVVMAVAGMALLSLGGNDLAAFAVGDLLVLGCALAFTGHILALGRFAPYMSLVRLTFIQVLAAGLLCLPLAVSLEPFSLGGLSVALPAVVFTAALATVGAYYVQARAQRFTSATHTALIFALEPVFAALFAYGFGGERLGGLEVIGCLLILLGILTTQLELD